jgi:HK97 family phage portal protein
MKWPNFLKWGVRKSVEWQDRGWNVFGSGSSVGYKDEKITPEAIYSGWVAKAINVRADAVAATTFELHRIDQGGDKVLVNDHGLLTLLNDVNPYFTRYWLFQRLSAHLDLFGNEFWLIIRGASGQPFELLPLDPRRVQIVTDPKTYVSAYRYTQYSGGMKIIPAKDIVHFKEFNPFDDTNGLSLVDIAAGIILTDKYLNLWNKNYYANSAMPDVVIEIPTTLKPEQVAEIRADWMNEFKGVDRRGKPAVLHSGAKVTPLQKSIADMQLVQQQNNNRDNILAMFGVSKTMIGLLEEVNLANAKTSEAVFLKRTILPRNINICVTINEFLMYQFDEKRRNSPNVKEREIYQLSPKVEPVSDQENTARNEMMFHSNIITKNEYRMREGLPEVDGGDEYFDNAPAPGAEDDDTEQEALIDLVDGTDVSKATVKKEFAAILKEAEQKKDMSVTVINDAVLIETTSTPVAEQLTPREALRRRLKRQTRMTYEKFEETGMNLKAKQDDSENPNVDKMKKVVRVLLDDQIARALRNVEAPTKDIGGLLNRKREIKATIDLLTPLLAEIVKSEGRSALDEVGASDEKWNLKIPSVREFIIGNTKKLAGSMTDTTINAIRSAVADGFEAEESIDQIAERVKGAEFLGDSRATSIALTETHRAAAFAENEAFKVSEVVVAKIWYTAEDERVCPDCEMMNGVEVGIDEPFLTVGDLSDMGLSNYDGDVETALLHPQCRCTVIPVIK